MALTGPRAFAALVLFAALALPGCFGSDDEGSSGPGGGERAGERSDGGANGGSSSSASADAGSGPAVEPAATRAELIRRGDRICRSAQASIRGTSDELKRLVRSLARKRISKREYYGRSADLTERTQGAVVEAVKGLRALGRPPERRGALERYLSAAERHAAVTGDIAKALRQRRNAELTRLNRRWLGLAEAAHNAARDYGFKVCGGN